MVILKKKLFTKMIVDAILYIKIKITELYYFFK